VLREHEQRNEQRCEGRNANCHGFIKESTGYRRGASVNFPDGGRFTPRQGGLSDSAS